MKDCTVFKQSLDEQIHIELNRNERLTKEGNLLSNLVMTASLFIVNSELFVLVLSDYI